MRLCLVAFLVVHLDIKFTIPGKKNRGRQNVVYPFDFSFLLLRLAILFWMTSSSSSETKGPTLFRFLVMFLTCFWKTDLRGFEEMWSRRLGIKANLKKGMFWSTLILFLVPNVAQLPEPFKEGILQRLEQSAPVRRQILKIGDKDSCRFAFGYFVFGVSLCFRNLVWELYRLDCNSVGSVVANHKISQRISGTLSIPYELA